MRILYLTHRIPFPPNKGDKIRSFNILKFLSLGNEVHLGALIDDRSDKKYVPNLLSLAESVTYDIINPFIKKAVSAFLLLNKSTISVGYFYSKRLQRSIDSLMEKIQFDVVLCSSSPMAEYIFKSKSIINNQQKKLLRVMDLIDVDSKKWLSYSEHNVGFKRWIYIREAQRLSAYEKRVAEEFDHVLLVSENEKKQFSKMVSTNNVTAVCNGVDLNYFSPDFKGILNKNGPIITFTGIMDYWPNIEGVKWFVSKVFPRIRAAIPNSIFYIVGNKPSAEVIKLALFDGIRVTGYVKDIRDYLAVADVCVAPLRIAQGIQNKVLEALSMGKAVVCTSQALEGLNAIPVEEIFVENDEHGFADAVITLIKNKDVRDRLGKRARCRVESSYSWNKNLSILNDILVVNKKKQVFK